MIDFLKSFFLGDTKQIGSQIFTNKELLKIMKDINKIETEDNYSPYSAFLGQYYIDKKTIGIEEESQQKEPVNNSV